MYQNDDKYKVYKQVVHTFYHNSYAKEEAIQKEILEKNIKIEPKIIYDSFKKSIKIEFKIGDKQLYKLKSLPEFYDRMLNNESYRYGAKLEFIHTKEAFAKEEMSLLEYILKYAEIIKYANEVSNSYGSYMRTISDEHITVSNTGLDELFYALKGRSISFKRDLTDKTIRFCEEKPEIKFRISQNEEENFNITTNIDVFSYDVLEGKEYIYFLTENTLYRCDKNLKNTAIKLLQIFRSNYTNEIKFKKGELASFCSIVYPNLKEEIEFELEDTTIVEKYIPEELYIKLYLDIDQNNYILADIKFVYGEEEFNPLLDTKQTMARDIYKENEVLDNFVNTGFMLDKENARLILAKEEDIYKFLSTEIDLYMQKFEVLATQKFKMQGIRQPKIGNVGLGIKNNLLKIDFSNIDFNIEELKEIMQKYRLKKKYHRLKDGSFLQLEENETMQFISSITDGLDIDYKQIEKGEIFLPINRSMYLDRLLQTIKDTSITRSQEYKQLVNCIDKKEINEEILIPANLNADLRNYQKVGYKWLSILDLYGLGGILADDMGLGKTVQMLAVILAYKQNTTTKYKPSIVVCPSSLTLNWDNEIKKFTPTLRSLVIRGNAEEREKQIKSISKYDVIVTSYDLLKRDIDIYKELKYEFKYIIADEAQYIKNNNTQNAKTIKSINSETRYALTGTPIENSLAELWSIFDFIMPGYLLNYKKFKEIYEIPISRDNDELAMRKLKMLIEPFILRRIKKEVLTELPDKTITVLNNEMQEEQNKIYVSYIAQAKKEAIQEIKENGFEKSQIKILALLMRLRQICCHPSLFLSNYKGESSKLNQCMEVVKDAVSSGHKILLFSGYTSMFEILEKQLQKENIKYFKLTGQTKVGERIKLVDEFNENDEVKVFLISLKAGGTGLNLIGADMVIHYDPWWNLSAENQATDRTYRIGQKKNVQVYKLITKNSIEEKIYELQQRKAKLAENLLSTDATFINKLSKEDIMSLFE